MLIRRIAWCASRTRVCGRTGRHLGNGCCPLHPPRGKYVLIHILSYQVDAEAAIDTPWDEPSDSSPEFCAYRTGELLNYDPWTRIRGHALGTFFYPDCLEKCFVNLTICMK